MPIMKTEGGGVIHLPYGKGQGRVRGLRQGGGKRKLKGARRNALMSQLSGGAPVNSSKSAAFRGRQ